MKMSFLDKLKILNMEIKHHVFDFLIKNNKNHQNYQINLLKEHFNKRELFFKTLEEKDEEKYTTDELVKFNIIYDCIFSYNINSKNFEDNINKYEFKQVLNSFNISKEEILKFIDLKIEILKIIEEKNIINNNINNQDNSVVNEILI